MITARVVVVTTDQRTHLAAVIGDGPLLTAEGCNIDDSEHTVTEYKDDSPLEEQLCERCAIPATRT